MVSELEALDSQIESYETSLKDTEERYAKTLKAFEERLVTMYRNSYVSYLNILADSENLINFFERLELISSIAKKDKEIVKKVQDIKKDLTYKKQLVQYIKGAKQLELIRKKTILIHWLHPGVGLKTKSKKEKKKSDVWKSRKTS